MIWLQRVRETSTDEPASFRVTEAASGRLVKALFDLMASDQRSQFLMSRRLLQKLVSTSCDHTLAAQPGEIAIKQHFALKHVGLGWRAQSLVDGLDGRQDKSGAAIAENDRSDNHMQAIKRLR